MHAKKTFTIIEHDILFSPACNALGNAAARVLVPLIACIKAQMGYGCFPDEDIKPVVFTHKHVAFNMAPNTFHKALRELEEHGFIRILKRGNGQANLIQWSWAFREYGQEEPAAANASQAPRPHSALGPLPQTTAKITMVGPHDTPRDRRKNCDRTAAQINTAPAANHRKNCDRYNTKEIQYTNTAPNPLDIDPFNPKPVPRTPRPSGGGDTEIAHLGEIIPAFNTAPTPPEPKPPQPSASPPVSTAPTVEDPGDTTLSPAALEWLTRLRKAATQSGMSFEERERRGQQLDASIQAGMQAYEAKQRQADARRHAEHTQREHRRETAKAFDAAWRGLSAQGCSEVERRGRRAALIAQALGEDTPLARNRLEKALEGLHPDDARTETISIIRSGSAKSPMGALCWRLNRLKETPAAATKT